MADKFSWCGLQNEVEVAAEQATVAEAHLQQARLQLQAAEGRADAAERALQAGLARMSNGWPAFMYPHRMPCQASNNEEESMTGHPMCIVIPVMSTCINGR